MMLNKLLNTGINSEMDHYLSDKVYLSNAIALLLEVLGFAFIIISIFLAPKAILLPLIGGNVSGTLVFLLNKMGKNTSSRILVSICPSITGALYVAFIVQDGEPMINSLYLIVITFALFIFLVADQRELKILISLMVYTGVLIFFMEKLTFWIDVPMSSKAFRTPVMETINYCVGIGIMFYLMWFLLQKNLITERKNLSLNQVLEERKNEIFVQNEELSQQQEEMKAQQDFIAFKNTELSRKNKLIQNSIKAASAIQKAVLPGHKQLSDCFTDYFLVYKPKDVVSGDFYWVEKQGHYTFLMAVDCTGHGVPGAFMTLIANNLLERIVRVWQVTDTATILTKMHEEIKRVLRQKETNNNNGMDAVFIRILDQEGSFEIQMAGAKNGLFYKKTNVQGLYEVKGTRKSIGGYQDEKLHFEQNTVVLPKNSVIYVGSDGLEDQNNSQRKKFTRKRLKSILEEHAHLSLDRQKKVLEGALNEHMYQTKQRDDILWIGVKL